MARSACCRRRKNLQTDFMLKFYCPKCKKQKPMSGFYPSKTRSSGRDCYCKACYKKRYHLPHVRLRMQNYLRTKYLREKDVRADKTLRQKFGINLKDYDRLFEEQNGLCPICGDAPDGKRFAVDHDHATGQVRGLLCHRCNPGIGYFRENIQILGSAIEYLKAFETSKTNKLIPA